MANSPLKKCATAGLSGSACKKTPENTAGQASSDTRIFQNRLFQQAANPPRERTANAFTLVEVMVVLVVIGVLAAFCVPSFQKAMEQSRADIAVANLRAVWAAQRLFWLEHQYYAGKGEDDPTEGLDILEEMGLLKLDSDDRYSYYFDQDSPPTNNTFLAVAERDGSDYWSGQLTINEKGKIEGEITSDSGTVITPGP